jgi:hypothetical protein
VRRAAAALICLLLVAGCGVGAGDTPKDVRLTVTDGFGERSLLHRPKAEVSGSDTVMRLLQRNAKVTTRYGGGFVQSIDGVSGGREAGRPVDWFYFVNGELADDGAAATKVRPGDHIWWDRHDWGVTNTIPAVVGSFPEPFIHGPAGSERLPTRVECDEAVDDPCRTAARKLADLGLAIGRSKLPTESGTESLRVIVGLWPLIAQDRAGAQLGRGPRVSGVYARPAAGGRRLELLDARGRTVRTLGPGSGLVAATRYREEPPTWVITGTDAAGVAAAAARLDERTLRNRYAVAVTGTETIGLPVAR